MTTYRWIAPLVFAVIGIGQALDSGVRLAPPHVIAIVVVAVLVPLLAFMLTTKRHVHGIAAIVCGILTVVARMVSPVSLPELTLVAFAAGVIVIFGQIFSAAAAAGDTTA